MRKTPISRKRVRTFSILYTIIVALGFFIINDDGSGSHNFAPAILWGTIFYKIMINQFKSKRLLDATSPLDNSMPNVSVSSLNVEKGTPPKGDFTDMLETWYTCPNCGQLVPSGKNCDCGYRYGQFPNERDSREIVETYIQPTYDSAPDEASPQTPRRHFSKSEIFRARYAAFIPFVIIALLIVSVWGWLTVQELDERVSYLSEELETSKVPVESLGKTLRTVRKEYTNLREKYQTLEAEYTEAAFVQTMSTLTVGVTVESDDGAYYHTFSCHKVKIDSERFWVMPITLYEKAGVSPCPVCHTDEEITHIHDLLNN